MVRLSSQPVITTTTTTTSSKPTGPATSTTTRTPKPSIISLPTSGCGCGSTTVGGGGGSTTTGSGTKYGIIAVPKHAKVRINQATGKLTFKIAKGYFGVFTCDVQYGNKVIVVHYTVKKSKTTPAACVA